jgi:hypothetical protein
MLRRIFGPKEEMAGGRSLHNEELHNRYASPNIIRVIRSRKMKWEGHVARTGKQEMRTKFWWEKTEGKRPLGRPGRK